MREHGFLLPAKRPTQAARFASSNGGSACHAPQGAAARCCSVWPLAGLAGAALCRRSCFFLGQRMANKGSKRMASAGREHAEPKRVVHVLIGQESFVEELQHLASERGVASEWPAPKDAKPGDNVLLFF